MRNPATVAFGFGRRYVCLTYVHAHRHKADCTRILPWHLPQNLPGTLFRRCGALLEHRPSAARLRDRAPARRRRAAHPHRAEDEGRLPEVSSTDGGRLRTVPSASVRGADETLPRQLPRRLPLHDQAAVLARGDFDSGREREGLRGGRLAAALRGKQVRCRGRVHPGPGCPQVNSDSAVLRMETYAGGVGLGTLFASGSQCVLCTIL